MTSLKNFRWIENKKLFLILFVVIFVLKFPIMNTPHHWDSISRDLPISMWIKNNNLNPFPRIENYNGHPVLFYEILALSFLFFGESLLVSHLVVLIFSFLSVYFTYLLGEYLYGQKVGIIAALLLLFSPLFFAQSGIVQIEIVFTALSIITIYFAIKSELVWYIISGNLLVLTKEPAILIIISILIYKFMKNSKKLLIYSIPLFIFALWMITNKFVFGWFLYPQSVSYFNFSTSLLLTFFERFKEIFVWDYKWILTLIISISILKFYVSGKKIKIKSLLKTENFVFLLIVLFINILNSLIGKFFLIRYILVLYPIFFIAGSNALNYVLKKNTIIIFVTLFLIGLFINRWEGNRTNSCGCELESNLEYLDLIETHKNSTLYIETNFPNSTVLTTWPQSRELTLPFLGYIKSPVYVKTVSEELITCTRISYFNGSLNGVNLICYSPQAHQPEKLLEIIKNLNLTLIKRFEKNGKYTEIYALNGLLLI
jgi:4-amino-4-deoxy-L-arabinose transferase-like glycosyltransferase